MGPPPPPRNPKPAHTLRSAYPQTDWIHCGQACSTERVGRHFNDKPRTRRISNVIEFIQANTSWIVLAVLFVLMMRMHGAGGMGCSGGHQHGKQDREPDQSERSLPEPRQEETGLQKEKEP